MPSLKAFGKRWNIGSDDIAVSAAFEATANGLWYVARNSLNLTFCRLVIYLDTWHESNNCFKWKYLTLYVIEHNGMWLIG